MSVRVIIPPAQEPVSVAEIKRQLLLVQSAHDAHLATLITAARQWVERHEWRALLTQTIEMKLDAFPAEEILVPRPPLQSGGLSIKYVDVAGTLQTLAAEEYQVDTSSEPGRIEPAYGKTWPATRTQLGAVIVTYKAGYGDNPTDVPQETRHAVSLLVAHWFEHREAASEAPLVETALAVRDLLRPVHDEALLEAVA